MQTENSPQQLHCCEIYESFFYIVLQLINEEFKPLIFTCLLSLFYVVCPDEIFLTEREHQEKDLVIVGITNT